MRIFRLHRRQRAASDYSGSLRFASRWNPAGTPMLYASTALSLACLELLVHLSPDQIPLDYVYTAADIPIDPAPHDFRGSLRDSEATQRYGAWVGDVAEFGSNLRSVRHYPGRIQHPA